MIKNIAIFSMVVFVSLFNVEPVKAQTNMALNVLYYYKHNVSTNEVKLADIARLWSTGGVLNVSFKFNPPHPSMATLYSLTDRANAEEVTNKAIRVTSTTRQTSYQKGRDKVIVDLINESVTNSVWRPLTVRAFRARIRRKLETHPQRSLERKRR